MSCNIRSGLTTAVITVFLIAAFSSFAEASPKIQLDWTKYIAVSRPGDDSALKAATDASGNIYVIGLTEEGSYWSDQIRGFLRKYDTEGKVVWTRLINMDAYGFGLTIDKRRRSLYLVGATGKRLKHNKSAGREDAFIRKYSLSGKTKWTRQFGSTKSDCALNVACGPDGAVYIAGMTMGSLTKSGFHGGRGDAFIRKYTSRGKAKWTKQLGTKGLDLALDVKVSEKNKVYLAGSTTKQLGRMRHNGGSDGFLRKYTSAGKKLWTRQFSGSSDDIATSIAIDSHKKVYVAGISGTRGFVRKYNQNGRSMWTHRMLHYPIWGASVDQRNRLFLAGSVPSRVTGRKAVVKVYSSKGAGLSTTVLPGVMATGITNDDSGNAFAVGTKGANFFIDMLVELSEGWVYYDYETPSDGFITKIH